MTSVTAASPAARAGLAVGDELLSIDGHEPRDVIDFQRLSDGADLGVLVRRVGRAAARLVRVDKAAGEPFGVEVSSAVFDRIRTCDNHCAFCFIYQLPKGMRRSLYLKDDDYRLSFLYGNFTTLTRFTELDAERILTERLGPLFVSIHATDPDLRAQMLRNPKGATSLRWLSVSARRRDRGARPGRRVPGGQRRRGARGHAGRDLGPLPAPGQRRRGAARGEPLLQRARHAARTRGTRRWRSSTRSRSGSGSTGGRWGGAWSSRPTSTTCWPGGTFPSARQLRAATPSTRTGSAWRARLRRPSRARPRDGPGGVRHGFFASVDAAPAEGYRAPRLPTAPAGTDDRPVTVLTGRLRRPRARAAGGGARPRPT